MGAYRLSRKAAADVEGIIFYVPIDAGVKIARLLHERMDARRSYFR